MFAAALLALGGWLLIWSAVRGLNPLDELRAVFTTAAPAPQRRGTTP